MGEMGELGDGRGDAASSGTWTIAGASGADAEQMQFISFAIGGDQYGVDIMSVREIKGWSEVSSLPKQPDYVRGVLNLRGIIIPIIDLRVRFGLGSTEATQSHIIIIAQIGQRLAGLLADRVLDIVAIDAASIHPVPKISRSDRAEFLSGLVTVERELIALIDLQHLLESAGAAGADLSTNGRCDAARPAVN